MSEWTLGQKLIVLLGGSWCFLGIALLATPIGSQIIDFFKSLVYLHDEEASEESS